MMNKFLWRRGIVISSLDGGIYKGFVQQIEGNPNLYVCLEVGKNKFTKSGIIDWREGEQWVENKIMELENGTANANNLYKNLEGLY